MSRCSGRALRVAVAYAGPDGEALVAVDVPDGATLGEAVERSGLVERFGLAHIELGYAIFGQRARTETPLRAGDRVELLRPLIADAKEVRRRHAAERPLPPTKPTAKRPR